MLFMCSWPTLYVFQPCWYPSSRSRIAIPRFPSCGCGTAALSEKEKLHGRKEPCGYFFSHHQQLVQLYPNPIRSSIDVLNTSFALPSWRIPCQTLAHAELLRALRSWIEFRASGFEPRPRTRPPRLARVCSCQFGLVCRRTDGHARRESVLGNGGKVSTLVATNLSALSN